jgi:hypothetical protein
MVSVIKVQVFVHEETKDFEAFTSKSFVGETIQQLYMFYLFNFCPRI